MSDDQRQLPPHLVAEARGLASHLLNEDLGRLAHSTAVAARAQSLAAAVASDQTPLLVAAAWLHDIGYAPGLKQTSFHPVDGARYLSAHGWPASICNLVAHHSGSRFVAEVLHLSAELAPFTFAENALTDALTVADQTVGPDGHLMTVDQRIADMLNRHGANSVNAQAHPARTVYIHHAARRVARRLETA